MMSTLWKKIVSLFVVATLSFGSATLIPGCNNDSDTEDAVENAGDAIEDAGDEVEDAADDAADQMEDQM